MRIVIATGIFPPDIGGPATYSKIVADEFVKRGHTVTIITYGDKNSKLRVTHYTLRIISRRYPKGLRHLLYFWHVLRAAFRADIIYTQDAVSAGFPVALAAVVLNKKFFLKVVGDHAWEQARQRFGVKDLLDDFLKKRYGLHIGILRFMQTFTAKHAEKIIVPSKYLKSVVTQWRVATELVVVIPNAVSIPRHVPAKEEARHMIDVKGFALITVGRLVPWKGFVLLVDIMPWLLKVIPDIQLYIVGSGSEQDRLSSHIARHRLQNNVHMVGNVSKDILALYLSAADVFCLNTSYEGFSHQLIETMAFPLPIITTSAGGNREVVRHGENAYVVEYNNHDAWYDAIIRLTADRDLYERLAKRKHTIVQKYTVENMIKKTESLFLKLL